MFRTLARTFLPNPLDWKLKRCVKRGGKRILLAWNRGLGDIALGLFAITQRIREIVPEAEITFLVRENLQDGFALLEGVETLVAPGWRRGEPYDVKRALHLLGRDPKEYDLVLEKPSPTDWVRWQRGKLTPRLQWKEEWDPLWQRFGLPDGITYVGVQVVAETGYGLWRNWPIEHWRALFDRLEQMPKVKVLLFGFGTSPEFPHKNIVDLRGKTTLFELLSIIKNRCSHLVLPDSGILSTAYYLDVDFPIQVHSLWADPNHGVLKQNVASPNRQWTHRPLIGEYRDLRTVSVEAVMHQLLPPKPLEQCPRVGKKGSLEGVGAIVLAGGQGSRLGMRGPKGAFCIRGKSLFQWIVEKAPEKFPIAVMTCPLNHEETVRFFEKQGNFGRELFFFQQEMHPFLDGKRQKMEMAGPAGNGAMFQAFCRAGLDAVFAKRGIDVVTIVPVDNPLADPADGALIAHHRKEGSDATLKCVERQFFGEQMGALVLRQGRIEILEYFDLEPGVFYPYCNTGMMALNLSLIQKMTKKELPLRWVKKMVSGREVFKGERFIFDALPFAEKVSALCDSRENCYAPLKSLENLPSIERLLSISQVRN